MKRVALLWIAAGLITAGAVSCKGLGRQQNTLGPNAGCYVCHMTFVGETISKVHASEKIGCTKCHGTSAAHANDEDIGATPPDVLYDRGEINAHCRTCHRSHDVEPERVVARLEERRKDHQPDAPLSPPVVCTDCHGEHKIAEAALP